MRHGAHHVSTTAALTRDIPRVPAVVNPNTGSATLFTRNCVHEAQHSLVTSYYYLRSSLSNSAAAILPLLPVSIARQPQHFLARAQHERCGHVLGHLALHGLVDGGQGVAGIPGSLPFRSKMYQSDQLPLVLRHVRLGCGKHRPDFRPDLRLLDVLSSLDLRSLLRRRHLHLLGLLLLRRRRLRGALRCRSRPSRRRPLPTSPPPQHPPCLSCPLASFTSCFQADVEPQSLMRAG